LPRYTCCCVQQYIALFDCLAQVLALLRCRMPMLPTNCSVREGAPVTATDVSCWRKFARYHEAVGLAMLSAAHAKEAAHHFSTAAVALASAVVAQPKPDGWDDTRQLALLMAACAALVPQLPIQPDRLMQFVNRLGVSPSQPLPPLSRRLCEPVRPSPKSHQPPLFSPFVAAAAHRDYGEKGGGWRAFIEGAGLDAAVELFNAALASSRRGVKLLRIERLVAWLRDNGLVMPAGL
jgi:hypothetical protein